MIVNITLTILSMIKLKNIYFKIASKMVIFQFDERPLTNKFLNSSLDPPYLPENDPKRSDVRMKDTKDTRRMLRGQNKANKGPF